MSEPIPVPAAASRPSSPSWIALAALVIALLAAGAAGWSLFKPAPTPTLFTAPAAENPKEVACRASSLVAVGLDRQSRTDLGLEPVALETVAANTRLAMSAGAAYLRDTVPMNTPAELAEPIAAFAGQLQDAAQHFFVGQTSQDPEQAARLTSATATARKIAELCK